MPNKKISITGDKTLSDFENFDIITFVYKKPIKQKQRLEMKNNYIDRKFKNKEGEFQETSEYINDYFFKNNASDYLLFTGQPGSGKSTTISNLVKDLTKREIETIYFSNPDEAKVKIKEMYKKIIISYGIPYDEQTSYEMMVVEISQLVHKACIPVYIIYDQVKSFKEIESSCFSSRGDVKTIVISQNPTIENDMPRDTILLEMPESFTPDEAKAYMKSVLAEKRNDITEDQIDQLLWKPNENGKDIPLTSHSPQMLECIATELSDRPEVTIESYIKRIEEGKEDGLLFTLLDYLMEERFIKERCDGLKKLKYTQDRIDNITKNFKKVTYLLQYLIYLDGEYISHDLAKKLLDIKTEECDSYSIIKTRLVSLSLIKSTINSQNQQGIKIHQLTQQITKDFIKRHEDLNDLSDYFEMDESEVFKTLLSAIDDLTPRIISYTDESQNKFSMMFPHIKKLFSMLEDNKELESNPKMAHSLASLHLKLGGAQANLYMKPESAIVEYKKGLEILEGAKETKNVNSLKVKLLYEEIDCLLEAKRIMDENDIRDIVVDRDLVEYYIRKDQKEKAEDILNKLVDYYNNETNPDQFLPEKSHLNKMLNSLRKQGLTLKEIANLTDVEKTDLGFEQEVDDKISTAVAYSSDRNYDSFIKEVESMFEFIDQEKNQELNNFLRYKIFQETATGYLVLKEASINDTSLIKALTDSFSKEFRKYYSNLPKEMTEKQNLSFHKVLALNLATTFFDEESSIKVSVDQRVGFLKIAMAITNDNFSVDSFDESLKEVHYASCLCIAAILEENKSFDLQVEYLLKYYITSPNDQKEGVKNYLLSIISDEEKEIDLNRKAIKKILGITKDLDNTEIKKICIEYFSLNSIELRMKQKIDDLMNASENGDIEQVKDLFAKGVDLNATKSDGTTSLILATWKGHKEIVEFLLNNGANVDALKTSGWTALMVAAINKQEDIAGLLISYGANIKIQSKDGWTALMAASGSGFTGLSEYLIDEGVDITPSNANGKTALMLAEEFDHKDIAGFIKQEIIRREKETTNENPSEQKEETIEKEGPIKDVLFSSNNSVEDQGVQISGALPDPGVENYT